MGVLKKKLKRYNIVTGILLAVVAGILHNVSPLPLAAGLTECRARQAGWGRS